MTQTEAVPTVRREIVAYIKQRLGPQLCSAELMNPPGITFGEAVESSVAIGSYDFSWQQGDYARVEKYIAGLKDTWLQQQGDYFPLLIKLLMKLQFGSDHEKTQLKKLLDIPD